MEEEVENRGIDTRGLERRKDLQMATQNLGAKTPFLPRASLVVESNFILIFSRFVANEEHA
jgi:hypothetical protein